MFDGMTVTAIAAVADNGVIGRDGALPWHLPDDLKRFKRLTSGHSIIMGRRTWQEIGKPLPKRFNVVLSRTLDAAQLHNEHDRLRVVASVDAALEAAARWERQRCTDGEIEQEEIFLIGGGGVWRAMWRWVDRFYLTEVQAEIDGDTRFPELDLSDFHEVGRTPGVGDPAHVFVDLARQSRSD